MRRVGLVFLLLLLGSLVGASQAPARGSIAGVVVDASSGQPIADALVTLSASPGTPPGFCNGPRQVTDNLGRFTFRECLPGTYALGASRLGYSTGAFGRVRAGGPGSAIDLGSAQKLDVGQIKLWMLGSFAGRIVDETGEPIAGVMVHAFPVKYVAGAARYSSFGMSRRAKTDDLGSYRISGVVAGSYVIGAIFLNVTVPPRLRSELARSSPDTKVAALGRYEYGRSIAALLDFSVDIQGARVLATNGEGPIPSLNPHQASDGSLRTPVTTFYPGTVGPAAAAVVVMPEQGREMPVNFSIAKSPAVSVTGRVMQSDAGVGSASVRLVREDDLFESTVGVEVAATVSDPDGSFVLHAVPPGRYVLVSSFEPVVPGAARPAGTTLVTASGDVELATNLAAAPMAFDILWAVQPISVGSTSLGNQVVNLRTGISVGGQLEFRPADARPKLSTWEGMAVTFESAEGTRLGGPWSSNVDAEGKFVSKALPPGRYYARVTGTPPGWFLVGAEVRGRDVTLNSFVPAEIESPLSVILAQVDTAIAGHVSGLPSPASRARVVVFPTDRQLWKSASGWQRRFRSTATTPAGEYKIGSLPPGEYWVRALPDSETVDVNDPIVLGSLISKATRVAVQQGQTTVVTILIPR